MFEPAVSVPPRRIVVSPMHEAAFGIPLIFSVIFHDIALFQIIYARREINVVRDQNRLAGLQAQNEALMTAAVVVVRENARNDSSALNLRVIRFGVNSVALCQSDLSRRKCGGAWTSEINRPDDHQEDAQ